MSRLNTMNTSFRLFRNRLRSTAGLIWLLLASLPVLAQAPVRELPPIDCWPRTLEEWQALDKERSECGPSFKDCFPDYAAEFDAHQQWLVDLYEQFAGEDTVYDAALADALIAELYRDHGHPVLNSGTQDTIVSLVATTTGWPDERMPAEARQRLLDGLLEYIQVGGGQCGPIEQAELSDTLFRLAPDDANVRALADDLLADAARWATEVRCPESLYEHYIVKAARRRWGDLGALWCYEQTLSPAALPPRPPRRYLQAVEKLNAVLQSGSRQDDQALYSRVRSATEASLAPMSNRTLTDDLRTRLLIVYRTLLQRKPPVGEKVCAYIEHRLMALLKDSGLGTERHWRLWVSAVNEMGPRVSKATSERLKALRDKPDTLPPAGRRAIEELWLPTWFSN